MIPIVKTILSVIPFISLLFSIIALIHTNKTASKLRKADIPLNWLVEVYFLSLTPHYQHRERMDEFSELKGVEFYQLMTPEPLDGMAQYQYSCKLKPVDAETSPYHLQSYLYIRNNSKNRISIDEFHKSNDNFFSGHGVVPGKGIIIGFAEYYKPSQIVLNYNGTLLLYDFTTVNPTGNALKPVEFA